MYCVYIGRYKTFSPTLLREIIANTSVHHSAKTGLSKGKGIHVTVIRCLLPSVMMPG